MHAIQRGGLGCFLTRLRICFDVHRVLILQPECAAAPYIAVFWRNDNELTSLVRMAVPMMISIDFRLVFT